MKIPDVLGIAFAPACCLLAVSGSALAQIGTIISPPALVNKNGFTDSGHDFAPVLVSDGADTWTCVFTTTEASLTNGGDPDIFWTRSRDLGMTWSVPTAISASFLSDTGLTSRDVEPAVATDGLSRMVVWSSTKNSPAGNYGIFSAYGTALSTTWTDVGPVGNAFASDTVDDNNPCIAGANGTYVTVWERNEGSGDRDLYFSRTTSTGGTTWSTPARVDGASATDTGADTHPRITTDGAGHWVIVFETVSNGLGTGADSEIYAYRSANDGVTWQGPSLVNATGHIDGSAYDTEPAIAVDRASGTWLCVWRTLHTFNAITGGDAEIAESRSTDFGFTWLPVGLVNADYQTDQANSTGDGEPFVQADQQGHFVTSWTRSMLNDADTDLRAARSDDLGVNWTNPDFIDIDATPDSGVDSHSQIVSDSFGHWLSVWQSSDNIAPSYGTDLDVLASRFLIPRTDFNTDFCYGYVEIGNAARCPCGNDSSITSRDGCLNSTGFGSKLSFIGQLNVSAPTETIQFTKVPPGSAALMFQGNGQFQFGEGLAFGDGRLCVGGILDRLGVGFGNAAGNGAVTFVPTGVFVGSTRFYQAWYRDSAAFCTSSTFNLSSAFASVWMP